MNQGSFGLLRMKNEENAGVGFSWVVLPLVLWEFCVPWSPADSVLRRFDVAGTGSALLPWTSPAQAFPLGRANNSEETAVIKTPTKRRHYCNRSENSNSKNTQKFVWLILGCITSGTIFLWSIHHFVLLANDDFCDRFIIWFSGNFVNEGMREKCRHSLTASKSEKRCRHSIRSSNRLAWIDR